MKISGIVCFLFGAMVLAAPALSARTCGGNVNKIQIKRDQNDRWLFSIRLVNENVRAFFAISRHASLSDAVAAAEKFQFLINLNNRSILLVNSSPTVDCKLGTDEVPAAIKVIVPR